VAKVCIKGIPWDYETGSIADFPQKGEYLHLPNEKYFEVISIFVPYEVIEVKRENIPPKAKIHYLMKPGTVGFDRNGPIVKR